MKKKLVILFAVLLVLTSCTANSAENDTSKLSEKNAEMQKIVEAEIDDGDYFTENDVLTYMENAVGEDEILWAIDKYKTAYPDDDPYKWVKSTLNSIHMEVHANRFTGEQAAALFRSEVEAECDPVHDEFEMEYSETPPPHAPSHEADEAMREAGIGE